MLSYSSLLFLLFGGQAVAFNETDYSYNRQIDPELKLHWKQVSGDEIHLALETKNLGLTFFLLYFLSLESKSSAPCTNAIHT